MNDTPIRLQFANIQITPLQAEAPVTRNTPQLPQALARLPIGSTLQGFVLTRDQGGNPVLRTKHGDFQIKSEFFLKTGSEVVIRTETQPNGNVTARILTVDGKTPEQIQQQLDAKQPIQQDTVTRSTNTPTTLQGDAKTNASLANLTSPAQSQPPATSQTTSSTTVSTTPNANAPVTTQTSIQILIGTTASATIIAPPAQPSLPTSLNALAPYVNPGQQLTTQIRELILPQTPTATTSAIPQPPGSINVSPQQGVTVTATVTGHNTNGAPVLQSPLGTLQVNTITQQLPVGTQVSFGLNTIQGQHISVASGGQLSFSAPTAAPAPTSTAAPSTATTAPAAPPTPNLITLFSELSHKWHTLEEAIQQTATQQNVAPQQTSIAQVIPNTSSEMVNSVLFFLKALSSGNVRRWLSGSSLDTLEASRPNISSALTAEFAGLSRLSAAQADTPWQTFLFPLMHEGELDQIRLYIRQDQHKNEQQRQASGQRFIVEATFSEFGDMQFDGLVRQTKGKTQFDMVIRTTQEIPEQFQHDIREIFNSASEITGFVGGLEFSESAAHLVHPLEDAEFGKPGSDSDNRSILA